MHWLEYWNTAPREFAPTRPEQCVVRHKEACEGSQPERALASPPPLSSAFPFGAVMCINLDRRPERLATFLDGAARAGMLHLFSRFPAVDGAILDLATFPADVAGPIVIKAADNPPAACAVANVVSTCCAIVNRYKYTGSFLSPGQ